jgi:hypothetical protein
MAVPNFEKEEWLEGMEDTETILLWAFAPSLTQITLETECRECGRPVYVSPYEKRGEAVLCILCGLKYFNESDREALAKALIPHA